jgi:hypothetical protein
VIEDRVLDGLSHCEHCSLGASIPCPALALATYRLSLPIPSGYAYHPQDNGQPPTVLVSRVGPLLFARFKTWLLHHAVRRTFNWRLLLKIGELLVFMRGPHVFCRTIQARPKETRAVRTVQYPSDIPHPIQFLGPNHRYRYEHRSRIASISSPYEPIGRRAS